jgi:small subunit ribosomal protein S17
MPSSTPPDPITTTMSETQQDTTVHLRKTRVGVVVSDKMNKTIVVEHVARVPHPKFNKIVKRSKKYYVHDESGEAKIGDRVRIVETRPLSKLKCWSLQEILSH